MSWFPKNARYGMRVREMCVCGVCELWRVSTAYFPCCIVSKNSFSVPRTNVLLALIFSLLCLLLIWVMFHLQYFKMMLAYSFVLNSHPRFAA